MASGVQVKVRPQLVNRERDDREGTVIGWSKLYSLGVDNDLGGMNVGCVSSLSMVRGVKVADTWDFARGI